MDIYEEIVRKYRAELVKFCISRMNRGVSAAEDVVQEVFLTLYRKKGIDFNDNIRTWLYETAKILMKKYMRENPFHDDLGAVEEQADLSQEIDKESVFDILTDEEKSLINAYYMGADKNELAKEYRTTLNAMYCKIKRIKQKLHSNMCKDNKS